MDTSATTVLLIAGPLILCLAAFAIGRVQRKPAGDPEPARSSYNLTEELELLRYENAVLRSDQQRTTSLGKAGERIRERLANVATSGTDEGDDAWGALTEVTVLRETMLAVCQDLQTAIGHVQTQLSSGVPITELDRRQADRGAHRDAASTEEIRTFTALPARNGHGPNGIRQTGT